MASVLIAGANRGIGLGLVQHFLCHSNPPALLIATYRDPARSGELKAIADKDSRVHILHLDVNDFSSFSKFAVEVGNLVGEAGLNLLINNAGIARDSDKLESVSPEDYIETYKTNVLGPIFLIKELLPLIKKAADKNKDKPLGINRAAIVTIASIMATVLDNKSGSRYRSYSYRESKSARHTFTISLGIELRDSRILVVPIHPGSVQTEMGGKTATITVDQSCAGLVKVMHSLDESNNGQFFNYDGSILPR